MLAPMNRAPTYSVEPFGRLRFVARALQGTAARRLPLGAPESTFESRRPASLWTAVLL